MIIWNNSVLELVGVTEGIVMDAPKAAGSWVACASSASGLVVFAPDMRAMFPTNTPVVEVPRVKVNVEPSEPSTIRRNTAIPEPDVASTHPAGVVNVDEDEPDDTRAISTSPTEAPEGLLTVTVVEPDAAVLAAEDW